MPSTHLGQGLTGVLLCGPGRSLAPLTSPSKLPKPLLPIANKPMIQYSLDWLLKGGITTIIVVCLHEHEATLAPFVKTWSDKITAGAQAAVKAAEEAAEKEKAKSKALLAEARANPELRLSVTVIATKQTTTPLSTAAVLRQPNVRQKIKSDFILLPCDLICEIPVGVLVNHWMAQQTTHGDQKGPLCVYYETGQDKNLERDVIVTSPIPSHSLSKANPNFPANVSKLSTLLVPLGQKPESVKLRTSLIEAHPRLSIHSTLRSAHIFIFPMWILDFIAANPYKRLLTVKDDVVELLAKASWQGRGEYAKKLGLFDILAEEGRTLVVDDDDEEADGDALKLLNLDADKDDFTSYSTTHQSSLSVLKRQATRDVSTRGWASDGSAVAEPLPTAPIEDEEREGYFTLSSKPKEPVYNGFYIPPFTVFTPDMEIEPLSTKPLVRRVDTIPLFLSTSLEVARNSPPSQPISATADIHQRCTVTPNDCIIGDGCKGDEKSLIKRSVLGPKVTISKLARVNGCVILEGATIGEGSKLEGCVIGRFAKVGKQCTLVGCQVAENAEVEDEVDAKNETFEEDDSDDDDDDSGSYFRDGALESEEESEEETAMPLSPRASKMAASMHLSRPDEKQQQGENKEGQQEEEEEEVEEDEDYEPSSSDSSFCAEEFDSQYDSDEADDDPAATEQPPAQQEQKDGDVKPSGVESLVISGTQETEAT